MKFRFNLISRLILMLLLTTPVLQSCYDDMEYVDPDGIPEGETTLNGEIDFMPMASVEMGTRGDASSASPGDGLSQIRDLCIVIYDSRKQLREIREIPLSDDMMSLVTRKEGDAVSNGEAAMPAESQTWRVKFQIENLPFGKYYIYGVANIGKYTEAGTVRSTYARLSEKKSDGTSIVQTPDELAALRLEWDPSEYRNNGGMLGHFTEERADHAPSDWNAGEVIVNRDNMSLHSWMRRAASKVTIDFDPSGLRDNIKVWIRKAEVCDIPRSCPLGMMNAPGSAGEPIDQVLYRADDKDNNASSSHLYYADQCFHPTDLDKDGETKVYDSESADHEKWPMLMKGSGRWPLNAHEETQKALFFFENRQNSNGPCKDKRQFPDQNGGVADSEIKKDNKPYGTYIEVEAYYQNLNSGTMSQGKIVYRFMLGQNEIDDYDAFRNHHYKVTMKFRGNANDVDWHIEYSNPEPIVVPVPYYISYLYKHDMKLPLKMTPKDPTAKITNLHAEIIRNDWYPYGGSESFYFTKGGVTDNNRKNRANGFLSLVPTDLTRVGSLSESATSDYNERLYYGEIDGIDRSQRNYKVDRDYRSEYKPTDRPGILLADTVNVTPDANGNGIEWQIPMYTRAKQLVKTSGYTGNNPYVGHYRMGCVRFTATLDKVDAVTGKNTIVKEVDVRQVERIVNPKGIYRKWNSREPFQVTLKKLAEEDSEVFANYISDGPWRAFIVRGDRGFIDIGKPGMKNVSGDSGTPIDFPVRFKGSGGEKVVKSCVIRVEYNNYSCVHLIYVRQGYEPQELFSGDQKWHIANMKGHSDEAAHPCDEGSMFRFANWNQPIDVGASHLPASNWAKMTPQSFFTRDDDLDIYGGTPTAWNSISCSAMESGDSFDTSGGKVAEIKDFLGLINCTDIEQGYGVLYADGATKTADNIVTAYGYNRALGHTKGYGMRGVFCYNRSSGTYGGRNIFFPIGNTGYGQRKDYYRDINGWNGPVSGLNAVLRYAASRTENMPDDSAASMPLFWDLYRKPGGIYWARSMEKVGSDLKGGLDINYFSFDFNVIDASNVFGTKGHPERSNACFVRCVD